MSHIASPSTITADPAVVAGLMSIRGLVHEGLYTPTPTPAFPVGTPIWTAAVHARVTCAVDRGYSAVVLITQRQRLSEASATRTAQQLLADVTIEDVRGAAFGEAGIYEIDSYELMAIAIPPAGHDDEDGEAV